MTHTPSVPADLDPSELRVLAQAALRWHDHGAVGSTTPVEYALLTRLKQVESAAAAVETADPDALRTALIESVPTVTDPAELAKAVAKWFEDGPSAIHPPTGEAIEFGSDDLVELVEALNEASGLKLVALWRTYDDEEDNDTPFGDYVGLHTQDDNGRLFAMSPAWAGPVDAYYRQDKVNALAALADPRTWIGELTDHTKKGCFERVGVNYALGKFYYY